MRPTYVYHWTHRRYLPKICVEGLDPKYSEGNLQAVWVGKRDVLAWALGHVSMHHRWDADDLVCLCISTKDLELTRTHISGVYVVKSVIPVGNVERILRGIGGGWEEF